MDAVEEDDLDCDAGRHLDDGLILFCAFDEVFADRVGRFARALADPNTARAVEADRQRARILQVRAIPARAGGRSPPPRPRYQRKRPQKERGGFLFLQARRSGPHDTPGPS